jgi:hypothetical protein
MIPEELHDAIDSVVPNGVTHIGLAVTTTRLPIVGACLRIPTPHLACAVAALVVFIGFMPKPSWSPSSETIWRGGILPKLHGARRDCR